MGSIDRCGFYFARRRSKSGSELSSLRKTYLKILSSMVWDKTKTTLLTSVDYLPKMTSMKSVKNTPSSWKGPVVIS